MATTCHQCRAKSGSLFVCQKDVDELRKNKQHSNLSAVFGIQLCAKCLKKHPSACAPHEPSLKLMTEALNLRAKNVAESQVAAAVSLVKTSGKLFQQQMKSQIAALTDAQRPHARAKKLDASISRFKQRFIDLCTELNKACLVAAPYLARAAFSVAGGLEQLSRDGQNAAEEGEQVRLARAEDLFRGAAPKPAASSAPAPYDFFSPKYQKINRQHFFLAIDGLMIRKPGEMGFYVANDSGDTLGFKKIWHPDIFSVAFSGNLKDSFELEPNRTKEIRVCVHEDFGAESSAYLMLICRSRLRSDGSYLEGRVRIRFGTSESEWWVQEEQEDL